MREIITYSLIEQEVNSDNYYREIYDFTDKVISKGEIILGSIVEEFINYIKLNNIEVLRSKEEYQLELLTLGILWQLYSDDAFDLSKLPKQVLNQFVELRQKGGVLKSKIDFIRGILSTIFLSTNDNYASQVRPTLENFKKLIGWLSATGEFSEEVKRFSNWKKYFDTLKYSQIKEIFYKAITFSMWFNVKSEDAIGKYTLNVSQFLKNKYPAHKWREDVVFCGRQRVEYHLNMVGAEIMNRAYSQEFLKTKKKKLLLPACMTYRPKGECRAKYISQGYICMECSDKCTVNKLTKIGNKFEFEVLIIPHESSAFKNVKFHYGEVGIVGVACVLNLMSGGWKARRLNLVPQCVILDYCGCKNHWHDEGVVTNININKLRKIFRVPGTGEGEN